MAQHVIDQKSIISQVRCRVLPPSKPCERVPTVKGFPLRLQTMNEKNWDALFYPTPSLLRRGFYDWLGEDWGEERAAWGIVGRRGNRASALTPSFFPSSPVCPLSPLFYLPPPLGSLCGGERSHTIERKWSSPNQKAPGSSDIRHEHDTSVGTASWLISSILYFQPATCNMGPLLIESIEHSRHTQSMNLSID